ncbi:MAG: hypothetical protein HYV07_18850 [Deltaproteobacteria bacterium]|nr:hypothetical protein [Deltaproteobacteria bacterium]
MARAFVFLLLASACGSTTASPRTSVDLAAPPRAAPRPVEQKIGARARSDPFAWLESTSADEVKKYLDAETRYALARTPSSPLSERIERFLGAASLPTPLGTPERAAGFIYEARLASAPRREILVRFKGVKEAVEEVALDLGTEGSRARPLWYSRDHAVLAYAVRDEKGRRAIRLREPSGRGDLPDVLAPAVGVPASGGDRTLFWVQADARGRGARLIKHVLGTPPTDDVVVYEEVDPAYSMSIREARDASFVFIRLEAKDSTEVLTIKVSEPDRQPRVIIPRRPGLRYDLEHWRDRFIVLVGSRVSTVIEAEPKEQFFRPLFDLEPNARIESLEVFADAIVVLGMRGLVPFVRARELSNDILVREARDRVITLADGPHRASLVEGIPFSSKVIRVRVETLIEAGRLVELELLSGATRVIGGHKIEGFDPSRYRIGSGAGADGTPYTLVGLPNPQSRPTVLVASCASGPSCELGFDSRLAMWLDLGFVVAIGHGATSENLAAVAGQLKRSGVSGKLVVYGRDADGLNAARAAWARPELFRAVLLENALVDPIGVLSGEATPWVLANRRRFGDPAIGATFDEMTKSSPYDLPAPSLKELVILGDPAAYVGRRYDAAKLAARVRSFAPGIPLRAFLGESEAGKPTLRASAYAAIAAIAGS